ncbi:MAG: serine acetyltransferase [Bacteroidota bacterium]
MEQSFLKKLYQAHRNARQIPSPEEVCQLINELLQLLFPELANRDFHRFREFEHSFQTFRLKLGQILEVTAASSVLDAEAIEQNFVERLPHIHALLIKDAEAICQGDPAAISATEVIRTYPGFYAIAIYRMAHALHQLKVPMIPRMLAEYAHGKTGIDIHPAARIGESFCIDHGTGIVIGETVEIGNEVKIYQGVTLGALSIKKEMAQTKRHPTIGDRVIIYAGATILGGDTLIGHDSVVGGNVWITRSLPPYSRIYYKADNLAKAPRKTDPSNTSSNPSSNKAAK